MNKLTLTLTLLLFSLVSCNNNDPFYPEPTPFKTQTLNFSFPEETIDIDVFYDADNPDDKINNTYYFTVEAKYEGELFQETGYYINYRIQLGYDKEKSDAIYGEHFKYSQFYSNGNEEEDSYMSVTPDIPTGKIGFYIKLRPIAITKPLKILFFNANKQLEKGEKNDTLTVNLIPKIKE